MATELRRGDIYLVNWNPARGSDQAGQRPRLVVQNDIANAVVGYSVTIVCAISSRIKGYPSMVQVSPSLENGLKQVSEVNTAQVMTVQKDRLVTRLGRLSLPEMKQISEKLAYMLGLSA